MNFLTLSLRGSAKHNETIHNLAKSKFTMESLRKDSIMDCHENFSNFLAMTNE
ncbi:hypothetical protein [Helicobacter sp.]|uniref:hypothetical protein n=1 Tax=Helicobacter sp. TaxID=218 RepID=UPI0019907EFC|nr:hypothetical protein [Helicobacter sp.]MBD5164812.1 hypothetical protein [Helicobacter sp.]